jgi:porin
MRRLALLLLALSLCVAGPHPARAEGGFDADSHLFGDLGGSRLWLQEKGVTVNVQEISELVAVPSGGLRRGAVYEGLTLASLMFDTEKLGMWKGGTLFISALQIHGRGPSRNLVGNLQTVSTIEASRTTRLSGLYYEQSLLDDHLSIRAGQFAADEEFLTNQYSAKFANASFGFPSLPAIDLPSGGPAYPLPTPGVRIKLKPTSAFTVLAAVFNGDPAGPGAGDPQERNADGARFRTHDGTIGFVEAQYTTDPSEGDPAPLASTYRIGAWLHSQSFPDQRVDSNGVSLVSANSTGSGKRHQGNYSVYASVDQRLWSPSDDKDLKRGIGAFARVMGSPADRNLVDFAASAGMIWIGALADRPDDTIGIGVNYLHVSRQAQGLDADMNRLDAAGIPIRSSETAVELNYLAQFGWLQVQPTLQYIVRPGGGVLNPNGSRKVLHNALVLGLRGIVTF